MVRTYTNPFEDRYRPNESLMSDWARVVDERLQQVARKLENNEADQIDPVSFRDLADAFKAARSDAHDAYWAEQIADREAEYHARFTDGYWVNVYEIGRSYGGPEEGGWWYDTGEPARSLRYSTHEAAEAALPGWRLAYPSTGASMSVLGGEDYRVVVEPHEAEPYPTERPHYE